MDAALHITPPPLAPTIAALDDDPRRALDRLREMGFRHVQLNAAQPGMRPRDLDRSARRDVLAMLRRREIEPAGLDLWIPPEHFTDPNHVDRAMSAALAAMEMAADLGRVPLSLTMPAPERETESENGGSREDVAASLIAEANRRGVPLADHAVFDGAQPPREPSEFFGIGVDPAAWLASGRDPARIVSACGSSLISARLCDLTASGMRAPIGTGRLDVSGYKVALSVAGYQRPVALDARQWSEPWAGIERSQNAWH